jgi:cytochrome bd-type quinol oxidase subunit 2
MRNYGQRQYQRKQQQQDQQLTYVLMLVAGSLIVAIAFGMAAIGKYILG